MDALNSSTIRFPFVVDSPRAKEASHTSSKEILKLIFEMNMLPQVILATMDYNDFEEDMKCSAKVTVLTEKKKLLNNKTYETHKKYIEEIFALLKDI